ncbi:Plasma membrane low glucose sensor [Rhizophlyctis rosea]|nr:Plasma membrane low glucose sensor [Rhizophlyctis rosea]
MHTNINVILICVFVSFGGFLFGFDTGLISGLLEMDAFNRDFGHQDGSTYNISSSIESLIVSILSVGTFIGALTAGLVADLFGRKWAIIASCVVFTAGIVVQIVSATVSVLVVGRFIAGLGVGLLSDLVPLYQAEAAPKHLRGTLVSCYQLAITLGLLIAFGVNQGTAHLDDRAAYRIPIGLQFVWAGILGFGMLILPDSPRGLLRSGKPKAAAKALARMRGVRDHNDPVIQDELREIQANLEFEANLGGVSYRDLFRGNARKRITLGIMLQAFQQLTGVNFIFYYGTTFFKQAGITQPYITQTITGVVNVISTIPGLFLIEHWGRRKLLLTGCAVMFIGQLIVGIVGTSIPAHLDASGNVVDPNKGAGISMIVFVCIFIFGFAYSWGPGCWVVASEIFPLRLRAKGISLATASNWFFNWLLAFVTPYLVNPDSANLGPKIAFIWAAFILLAGIYTYFFMPETKGLALEDVDEMFESGVSPRRSSAWQPSGLAKAEMGDSSTPLRTTQKGDFDEIRQNVGPQRAGSSAQVTGGIPPSAD